MERRTDLVKAFSVEQTSLEDVFMAITRFANKVE